MAPRADGELLLVGSLPADSTCSGQTGPGLTIITNMGFRGWPAEAIDFYDGLEEDNSKSYWQAHKAAYEQAVLRPMEELLDDLAAQYGPGRIFRPYRDVRFSADKSPYKTAIGATLGEAGYIRLSAAGLPRAWEYT